MRKTAAATAITPGYGDRTTSPWACLLASSLCHALLSGLLSPGFPPLARSCIWRASEDSQSSATARLRFSATPLGQSWFLPRSVRFVWCDPAHHPETSRYVRQVPCGCNDCGGSLQQAAIMYHCQSTLLSKSKVREGPVHLIYHYDVPCRLACRCSSRSCCTV